MSDDFILPVTRMAYVDVANTGVFCSIKTRDGEIQLHLVQPHGVQVLVGGLAYGISKDSLPFIGRYFFAAASRLGVDINEGWDSTQHHTDEGFLRP
jgi:hypothetical protein